MLDFDDGSDLLDLSSLALAEGFADLLVTQVGDRVVIALDRDGGGVADDANAIALLGRQASQIGAGDFEF